MNKDIDKYKPQVYIDAMKTADEYDSVELPENKSDVIIDQIARTWRRCHSCKRHYLTESHPLGCPRCKLPYGENKPYWAVVCRFCEQKIDLRELHICPDDGTCSTSEGRIR